MPLDKGGGLWKSTLSWDCSRYSVRKANRISDLCIRFGQFFAASCLNMNPFIRVIGICFFRVFIGAPVLQGLRIQIHIVFIDFDRVSQGDFPPGRNYRVMPSHAKSCQVMPSLWVPHGKMVWSLIPLFLQVCLVHIMRTENHREKRPFRISRSCSNSERPNS